MANFNDLITALSESLNVELYPDINNVVTMIVETRVKIQLEIDATEEFLLIGAYTSELPPGKFREHILKDALKANFGVDENLGILSYAEKKNMLMLHRKIEMETLSPDALIQSIKHLVMRAKKWQDAMESGHSSPEDELPNVKERRKKNIFEQ